jgi:type VII secretion-associated serine protease mycosin
MKLLAAPLAIAIIATSVLTATPAHADAVRDHEYWLTKYGITSAWAVTKGAGITIAVIDSGVDGTHPDLRGVVVGGTDFSGHGASNGQRPTGPEPEHATMVASLAAGRGHGGAGVIGAAPAASVLSISIGFGDAATDSDDQIAKAVRWAVDNGAKVINMSFTRNTLDWPESWDDAFLYAMSKDVVIVAAAGNRGSGTPEVGAPASMPGVLTVAGVDKAGRVSQGASAQGITIGVAAPSEQLVGALPGGGYALWDGSSGAAPIVAGIVALVRAAHPDLDAANVINRIVSTATPAGANGNDPLYGFGLVNAAAAVSNDVPKVTENPMGDLKEWVRLFRRAEASPSPTAVASPTPEPSATAVAAPFNPLEAAIPTISLLRDVGIPLLVYLGFGGTLALLVVGARRYFERRRVR